MTMAESSLEMEWKTVESLGDAMCAISANDLRMQLSVYKRLQQVKESDDGNDIRACATSINLSSRASDLSH